MAKKEESSKNDFMRFMQLWWVPIVVGVISLGPVIIRMIVKQEPSPTTETAPLQTFQYLAKVQAQETGKAIPNATFIIEVIGQALLDEVTDSNGVARISIEDSHLGQPGKLTVEAAGYEQYIQNIDLTKDELPDLIQLVSVSEPTQARRQTEEQ